MEILYYLCWVNISQSDLKQKNQLLFNRYINNLWIQLRSKGFIIQYYNSNWIQMGNTSFNQELFPYNSHTWQPYTNRNHQSMMMNEQTGVLALAHTLKDYDQHYIDCLELRARNSSCLVNVIAILDAAKVAYSNEPVDVACPMNFKQNKQIVVLIQDICYRLSDLGTVKYNDGIYILSQCVEGLKIISQKYRNFDFEFQQEMIGFNKYGECKIWFQTNYFKALTVVQQGSEKETQIKVKEILERIFCCVEDRMEVQMTQRQRQQYNQVKNTILRVKGQKMNKNFCYQIGSAIQFCKMLCLFNKMDIDKFKVEMPQSNQSNNICKQDQSTINKKQKYLLEKGKISLKFRNSQSKKDINTKRLEKQNQIEHFKIRNSLRNEIKAKSRLSFKNPQYQQSYADQRAVQIESEMKDSRSTFFTHESRRENNFKPCRPAKKSINRSCLVSQMQ